MNPRARNLMFLLGMAPLGLGCRDGQADDDGSGTETDTGDTGSTGSTATGSTTAGTATTAGSTSAGTATDDGTEDTGPSGDLCQDFASSYADCYGADYASGVLEWCEWVQGYVLPYNSNECQSAWVAAVECQTTADCGLLYEQCELELMARAQACYSDYNSAYETCYMVGEFVAGCVGPDAFEGAMLDCVDTYESLSNAHGGACGDAFLTMMVCISQLECLALSDKQYVYASCGIEIQAKNMACQ